MPTKPDDEKRPHYQSEEDRALVRRRMEERRITKACCGNPVEMDRRLSDERVLADVIRRVEHDDAALDVISKLVTLLADRRRSRELPPAA